MSGGAIVLIFLVYIHTQTHAYVRAFTYIHTQFCTFHVYDSATEIIQQLQVSKVLHRGTGRNLRMPNILV